ncbi:MAG: glycosyltransferase [Cyclobacteriaceae bacterium]|nr:glycosyltransferase family 2 protein [Cyclobacteriaceae bacterium]MCH8515115.1 glycosyltransferase [Cyclobacteriaceae bacterium]
MFIVSVKFTVFNNSKHIYQSIRSILMQKTNFPIEIVVGDDFSTDKSLDILKNLILPSHITIKFIKRPFNGIYHKNRKKNGYAYNAYDTIKKCSGKYIAFLDPDDYWTDPNKLQSQVDFLEKNGSYTACVHEYRYYYEEQGLVLRGNRCNPHISSLVCKNFDPCFLKYLYHPEINLMGDDTAIFLFLKSQGKLKRLKNIKPSIYRIHPDGIYSQITKTEKTYNQFIFIHVIDNIFKKCLGYGVNNNYINAQHFKFLFKSIINNGLIGENIRVESKYTSISFVFLKDILNLLIFKIKSIYLCYAKSELL